jgi:hypothetical protein
LNYRRIVRRAPIYYTRRRKRRWRKGPVDAKLSLPASLILSCRLQLQLQLQTLMRHQYLSPTRTHLSPIYLPHNRLHLHAQIPPHHPEQSRQRPSTQSSRQAPRGTLRRPQPSSQHLPSPPPPPPLSSTRKSNAAALTTRANNRTTVRHDNRRGERLPNRRLTLPLHLPSHTRPPQPDPPSLPTTHTAIQGLPAAERRHAGRLAVCGAVRNGLQRQYSAATAGAGAESARLE